MSSLLPESSQSPQARLAESRRAIIRQMSPDSATNEDGDSSHPDEPMHRATSSSSSGTWGIIKRAIQAWWNHHPVSVALDLVRPAVGRFAEDKPFKLLAFAAGAGVVAVLFRPWRLVSLGGVMLAALKSSEISGALHSVLSNSRQSSAYPGEN